MQIAIRRVGANRSPAGYTDSRQRASWGFYAVAALTVIVSFFPTVWIFLTSIKEEADIYAWPVVYLPQPATLENYHNIVTETPELLRFILNSAIVATTTTARHSGLRRVSGLFARSPDLPRP